MHQFKFICSYKYLSFISYNKYKRNIYYKNLYAAKQSKKYVLIKIFNEYY